VAVDHLWTAFLLYSCRESRFCETARKISSPTRAGVACKASRLERSFAVDSGCGNAIDRGAPPGIVPAR
jgi:hypothetical protein